MEEDDDLEFNITSSYQFDFIHVSLPFSITYNAVALVGAVINMFHFFFLIRMPLIMGQENYRFFLTSLAVVDGLLTFIRVCISNEPTQEYMLDNRWLCIGSGITIHSLLLCMTSILLMVSIDRSVAVILASRYRQNSFVVNFKKITTLVISAIFIMYIVIGIVMRDRGFRVKGLGGCKFGTERAPFLGMITVISCFLELIVVIALYIMVLLKTYKTLKLHNRGERDNVVLTIGILIFAKFAFWCPIMVTVALRGFKLVCEACEWIGLLTMSLNSIANPLLYGALNRSYRNFICHGKSSEMGSS